MAQVDKSTVLQQCKRTGLEWAGGVTVDSAGAVYVADIDHKRVLKLSAGSGAQTELPFTDLQFPRGVAVDTAGNLYVTDIYQNLVLKLPVQ